MTSDGGYEGDPLVPAYSDDVVTLYKGDAHATLAALQAESVDCIVTSPPYFGLRDYGIEGQYGLEDSPAEYVETMRQVFAEARRVLADDGTLWLNIGDSYVSGPTGPRTNPGTLIGAPNSVTTVAGMGRKRGYGLPEKNLLGIPWRVAFALQDDGWTLRNAIVWHKPNAMPESVTDRLSTRYEPVFLFSKARRYHFDLDAIRVPLAYPDDDRILPRSARGEPGGQPQRARMGAGTRADRTNYAPGMRPQTQRAATGRQHQRDFGNGGRNPGDVWSITTQPFSEAHFAVMPPVLAERCILAGCKPGGTVLDPFSGSGTTGMAAAKLGRRYVGIDISAEYLDLSLRTRLGQSALCDAPPIEALPGEAS